MNWYDKVSKDISNIPDAAAYYEAELIEAKQDVRIAGNIEKASSQMPGIVEERFNQLQEIEGILEYLNIELRRLRSQHFRKYLENYQRALSSRDCEKFVEGEADVVDFEKIINDFAYRSVAGGATVTVLTPEEVQYPAFAGPPKGGSDC